MELTEDDHKTLLQNLHHDLQMAIRSFCMHRAMYETVKTRGIKGQRLTGSRAFETAYLCTKEESISALSRILDAGEQSAGSLFGITKKSGICKPEGFDTRLSNLRPDTAKDKAGKPQETQTAKNALSLKKWRDSLVAHRDAPATIGTKLSQVQDFDFATYESLLKDTYWLVDELCRANGIHWGVTTGGLATDETLFDWDLRKGKMDGALLTNALFPPGGSVAQIG